MLIFEWLYQKIGYFVHIFILESADRYIVRFDNHMSKQGKQYIKKAYILAMKIHYGQYRGDGVTSYFTHCLDVGNYISVELGIKNNWEINASALLHDTVEDGDISIDTIKKIFGSVVAHWTDLMTKTENKATYIPRMLRAKIIEVFILKLSDRVVNLRTLGMKAEPEFQIRQINETIEIFLPMADLLIDLIAKSEKWQNRKYIGLHIKAALENQILSFRAEFGDRIISITDDH
ncbi:MAG: HD domain-containing protein [Patescibacteria group bacterium]|jgi:(p)ppGpp synthase/HD superfamily hydrolase